MQWFGCSTYLLAALLFVGGTSVTSTTAHASGEKAQRLLLPEKYADYADKYENYEYSEYEYGYDENGDSLYHDDKANHRDADDEKYDEDKYDEDKYDEDKYDGKYDEHDDAHKDDAEDDEKADDPHKMDSGKKDHNDNEVGLEGDNGFGPNNDWDQDRLINDVECPVRAKCVDSDGDGFVNYRDRDDDNDGIETRRELTDTDGDTVSDHLEPNHWDLDQDGYYNHNDPDDDGDGKPTREEVGPDMLYPVDVDEDLIPDYLDPDDTNQANTADGSGDSDGDGFSDKQECASWPCIDTDYDNLPDYLDVDDDGDGILTVDEPGDVDGDGVRDSLEPNMLNTDGESAEDQDAGGVTNVNDTDDDGDGIPTAEEVGNPILPTDVDEDDIPDYRDADTQNAGNTLDGSGDSDQDSRSDILECAYGPCPDTDNDNVPNYNDPDDDNDGIASIDEYGDSDGDTVPDYLEPNNEDLDQDMVYNYVDPDDDGDGINTIDEVGSNPLRPLDTNENDVPDYLEYTQPESLLDSDGDGIPDVQECPAQPCVDTDGDGAANAFDPDDDNDTIPTAEERSKDEDGDRVPDHLEPNNRDYDQDGLTNHMDDDDDNDGIPTRDELGPDYLYPLDTDNDLIPDYLDGDSTNVAGTEDGTGDTDGDGASDGEECPMRPCADTDTDGIPDYFDPDAVGVANPNDVLDRNLDGDGPAQEAVITTNTAVPEGGALGMTLGTLLGLMLAARASARRSTRRDPTAPAQQALDAAGDSAQSQRKLAWVAAGCLPLVIGLHSTAKADVWPLSHFSKASDEATEEAEAEPETPEAAKTRKGWHVYGGGALGISRLKPETENTGYTVTDDSDTGYKVIGGIQLNDKIQFETSFNRLGASQVAFNSGLSAAVDYDVFSFDVLYKLPTFAELPFHTFAIVGLTALDNDSTVRVEKDATVQLKGGVALEYPMRNDWALRGTAEKFSGDTAFFSAGVVKYFRDNEASKLDVAANAAGSDVDSDGDGVPDSRDKCPNTLAGLKVDKDGCGIFNRSFDDITFRPNSTELTTQARGVLDGLAQELAKVSHLTVEVQAHTDNIGTAAYNVWLSTKRAEAIITYLVQRGISAKRLKPKGYGETKPVATNDTPAGRAQNRRAEFHILD